ncbi:MAG: heavy metal translocating P-type ATPase [Nitrospinota bacterium]
MPRKDLRIIDTGTDHHFVEVSSDSSCSCCDTAAHGTHEDGKDGFDIKAQLSVFGLSAALFVVGLYYRSELHDTPFSIGEYIAFISSYLIAGWPVLSNAARNILRGRVFDENFLMSIATLGAIAIHELPEAVGVMLFFKAGEFFQELSVARSRRSIKSLLELRPDFASVLVDGELKSVPPEQVKVGDTIVVRPGERIPLDGEVLEGSSQVDTSALTGEPVPRSAGVGDVVLAGMINTRGTLTLKVLKPFSESSLAKILQLAESAGDRKAPTEKFITSFARYYTPIVVLISVGIAVVPPLVIPGASFSDWLYRALVVLVISCPCALVISIPLGYFGGVGGASRRGILVKGSNFLDALTQVKTIVFDKTGTLTKGTFKVTDVVPHNGALREELLRWAALAESQSNHPIAQSIMSSYKGKLDASMVKDYQEIAGHGVKAAANGSMIVAGNDKLMHVEKVRHPVCDVEGTVVHVAVDGEYKGYIVISDELKDDAHQAMRELKALGVRNLVMFTGDNQKAAEGIAKRLGLDSYRAELLPDEKVSALEKLMREQRHGKVAFVGDGINDAPVLRRADVGIAMGELGSDAAIDTADVVLMNDRPSKVAEAISIARKTHRIVWQNISLALSVKGVFIVLGIFGIATMWEAVFADMGVALAAILNATRALRWTGRALPRPILGAAFGR